MAVSGNLLIVEGKDDLHVMLALRDKLQFKGTYEVAEKGDVGKLLGSIEAELIAPGRKCLGIIVDKDTNDPDKNKNRWEQIKVILSTLGYEVPESAPPGGAILPSPELGFAKMGIWLMPDNQNPGMLEDFMRNLIVQGDDCLSFAEETLNELEKRKIQRYKEVHRAKALMHTWIAWQDQPGIPLGQSATRYLDTDTPLCQQFANWLNRLFNEEE